MVPGAKNGCTWLYASSRFFLKSKLMVTKHWTKWTERMDEFLTQHYHKIGDKTLAWLFEKKFPKHYKWTLKHIERRRFYLGLKRTPEEVFRLNQIKNGDGRHSKMWITRGASAEGTIKTWRGRKYIKINGKFVDYHRHEIKAKKGQIVRSHEGMIKIIDRKENQRLNAEIRKSLPPDLKATIKILNKLKNHVKENSRPA